MVDLDDGALAGLDGRVGDREEGVDHPAETQRDRGEEGRRGDDGAGPVSVTAVELGQAPAKTPRR